MDYVTAFTDLIFVSFEQEENDALRCQLEASKNEVDLIKADLRSELDLKDQQLKILQQVLYSFTIQFFMN